MIKENYVSRIAAARLLGVAPKSVDAICKKNRVKTWQLPGHTRRLYSKPDLLNLISLADQAAQVNLAS